MQQSGFNPAKGRLLAVGDIHGHADKLIALMEQVQPTASDRVVFVGDYIDRGPDSKGVIDYLLDFGRRFPNTVFLRGDHEDVLLVVQRVAEIGFVRDIPPEERYHLFSKSSDWGCTHPGQMYQLRFLYNGGGATLKSYEHGCLFEQIGYRADYLPPQHLDFLRATRISHLEVIDGMRYFFVHAGIWPTDPIDWQDEMDLLFIDERFLHRSSCLPDDLLVVHGHTSEHEPPGTFKGRINVDSGVCQPNGKLTCCNVLTREYWQTGGESWQ